MMTKHSIEVPDMMAQKYLNALIGQFYKILPIRESGEPTLKFYMESLQREMLGCKELMDTIGYDELYLSLLSILQYMIDNDCEVAVVKSDVFKAINICKKLQKKYFPDKGV